MRVEAQIAEGLDDVDEALTVDLHCVVVLVGEADEGLDVLGAMQGRGPVELDDEEPPGDLAICVGSVATLKVVFDVVVDGGVDDLKQ